MGNDFLEQIKTLQKQNQFHIALLKLEEIEKKDSFNQSEVKINDKFYHLKAQCYYQDLKLPTKIRFSKALDILKLKCNEKNNETLRLKGAIYKRKYQHSKDVRDLYDAINCYENAAKDTMEDMGYAAGNVVYLYGLLVKELNNRLPDDIKEQYLKQSEEIANKALDALKNKAKESDLASWHCASKSALHLSLREFTEAKEALQAYKDKSRTTIDRDQAITLKQTIELFDVLPNEQNDEVLEDILSIYGNARGMIGSVRKGKIGLALSGGGFRASLFHIGTLLRLAELDILRNVQVISTVSGGSIIGMYYYLEVKKLLESKNNDGISKQEYIDLVLRIKKNFSRAIRENNIRMLAFQKKLNQNLTEKLGELYQEKLYDPIFEDDTPIKNMSELKIKPKIDGTNQSEFIPEFHNFELENKVPRIIVNATLLNNGHNWQFTAEGMGENPYMVDELLETNTLYAFEYYKKIDGLSKDDYLDKDISIAKAIASSSAVPVLFDPIDLKDFDYEKPDVLRLSDGGLYDNLGLSSLLADECTHIIVSDGSKQLQTDKDPSIFRLDVSRKTTDVLMHRTRDGEYKMAKSLKERGVVEKLDIIHLQEVDSGIDKDLQGKIASIRTDLDSFHELEAEAIMYAGYKICSNHFKNYSTEESTYFDEFIKKFNENKESVLNKLGISSKVLFKLFCPATGSGKTGFKSGLKFIVNKFFSLIMIPISWGYLKLFDEKYLRKGSAS